MEKPEPLEFLKVAGCGSRRNSVPEGKPWVCEGSAGQQELGEVP